MVILFAFMLASQVSLAAANCAGIKVCKVMTQAALKVDGKRCGKFSRACSKSCNKQEDLDGISGAAKGITGAALAMQNNYNKSKNKADKIHRNCSSDKKKVDRTCGWIVSGIEKAIKFCKASKAKAKNKACKKQFRPYVTKLEELKKKPEQKQKECAQLAGNTLPEAKKVGAELIKMLAALAPALGQLREGNNEGQSDQASEDDDQRSCEQRLKRMKAKNFKCSSPDGKCCERFPCAKGCKGSFEIADYEEPAAEEDEAEDNPSGGMDLRDDPPEMRENPPVSDVSDPVEDEQPPVADLPPPPPPPPSDEPEVECFLPENFDHPACVSNEMKYAAMRINTNQADIGTNSNAGKNSIVHDPETTKPIKKPEEDASVPAPNFDSVSTSWGDQDAVEDNETMGFQATTAPYGSDKPPQIAPRQGKSSFERISGAYERQMRKGRLIQ